MLGGPLMVMAVVGGSRCAGWKRRTLKVLMPSAAGCVSSAMDSPPPTARRDAMTCLVSVPSLQVSRHIGDNLPYPARTIIHFQKCSRRLPSPIGVST